MIDQDTAERAAYQRAVELAKDEIARLRSDVFALRTALEQQQRATEAERAARQIADADVLALRHALDGTTRMMAERSDNNSRGMRWMRAIVEANQQMLVDHPGAALLSELDAARAVVAAAREVLDNAAPVEHDVHAVPDMQIARLDRAVHEATKARGA